MSSDDHPVSIPRLWRLRVDPPSAGLRIDQFLAAQLQDLSRGDWRKVVDLGGVHHNGRRIRRCSTPVAADDSVEVYLDGRPLAPFRLAAHDFVYHDDYLVAINKPAGVETQPTHARFAGTLYEALGTWLRDQPSKRRGAPEVGMIQRLDRDTSGLLVFSIHPRAHAGLTRAFTERRAHKSYLALVQGRLVDTEGEFRSQLARSRKGNLVKSVPAGGKDAVTRYRLISTREEVSLVLVEPLTGRSHQIRVHFAEAGHPLLGDLRYGGPPEACGLVIGRQQLHAWRLAFPHPVDGRLLSFEAPPAADMLDLLERLGLEEDLENLTSEALHASEQMR